MDNIPRIGFGTYKLQGEVVYNSVIYALRYGYRLIDTANLYKNESDIGKALKHSNIKRSDIWITTKIQTKDLYSYKTMFESVITSLSQLDIEYIDLVIVHGPNENIQDIPTTWNYLETIFLELKGKIRYIGVSNYDIKHLELLKTSHIKPYLNQFEVNPYLYRNELIGYCKNNNIIPQAHSSFVFGERINDKKLLDLSEKIHMSPSNILLRWAMTKGLYVLPRSSNPSHIKNNIDCVNKTSLNLFEADKDIINYIDTFYQYENDNSEKRDTKIGYSIYPNYLS